MKKFTMIVLERDKRNYTPNGFKEVELPFLSTVIKRESDFDVICVMEVGQYYVTSGFLVRRDS